jgi:hypothetical protein
LSNKCEDIIFKHLSAESAIPRIVFDENRISVFAVRHGDDVPDLRAIS